MAALLFVGVDAEPDPDVVYVEPEPDLGVLDVEVVGCVTVPGAVVVVDPDSVVGVPVSVEEVASDKKLLSIKMDYAEEEG